MLSEALKNGTTQEDMHRHLLDVDIYLDQLEVSLAIAEHAFPFNSSIGFVRTVTSWPSPFIGWRQCYHSC